jgi:hypothetical protein
MFIQPGQGRVRACFGDATSRSIATMQSRTLVSAFIIVAGASCADPECGDAPYARVTAHMLAFPSNETPEGGVASLDEALTSTSKTGAAEIGGLAATESADDRVALRAEKAGCDVSFASYPHTGRYALANGVLTGAAAFMPPIDAP